MSAAGGWASPLLWGRIVSSLLDLTTLDLLMAYSGHAPNSEHDQEKKLI